MVEGTTTASRAPTLTEGAQQSIMIRFSQSNRWGREDLFPQITEIDGSREPKSRRKRLRAIRDLGASVP